MGARRGRLEASGLLGQVAEKTARSADHVLVARFRAGDQSAFTELYERYYPRLKAFCRKRLGNHHMAEELAQETFVKAFLTIDRLQPPYRVFPWLTTVARRLAVDTYRRDGRVQPQEQIDLGPDPQAEAPWSHELDGEDVRTALSRIQDRHREVLFLRAWEDLTYEQIAERIGSPTTTVPPLMHRALLALRREYLAVTKDRVAGFVPWLVGLPASLRRLRARTMQWMGNLPDPSALSAPAAGLVISVASVFTPVTVATLDSGPPVPSQWNTAASWPHTVEQSIADAPAVGHEPFAQQQDVNRRDRTTEPSRIRVPARKEVPGVADVGTDGSSSEGWRETQGKARQMPIYFEYGPVFFGLDPDAAEGIVKDTTSGEGPLQALDPSWIGTD